MNTRLLALSALSLGLALAGCSSEASKTPSPVPASQPSAGGAAAAVTLSAEYLAAVWPEANSKVFESFDMLVGPSDMDITGIIAVIQGDPVPAGEVVARTGSDVQFFPEGHNHGSVTLPIGEQTVTVQMLDGERRSLGAEMSHSVTYNVVAMPDDVGVAFTEPEDGATVKSPFRVVFDVYGMTMSPAMQNADDKTRGHHHVLLNKEAMVAGIPIPKDATHLHYGDAQEEAELTLEPGEYVLTMQYADGNHRSYGRRMSAQITVTVE